MWILRAPFLDLRILTLTILDCYHPTMSVIDETKAAAPKAAPAEAEPSKKEVKMAADVPAEEKPATKVSYVTMPKIKPCLIF